MVEVPPNSSVIDIKDAYMQIRADPDCSRHQTVWYRGQEYELTRVGFGLNCTPQILKAVVSAVLGANPEIQRATNAYFDDIIINEDIVSAEKVRDHLKAFGLVCKPPTKISQAMVLGLRVRPGKDRLLAWFRPQPVPVNITPKSTRRQLFSVCGKWISHFPVGGWLRLAVSYVKRLCNGDHGSWEEPIAEEAASRANEIAECIVGEDPVRGSWLVRPGSEFTLWCDASSLAMGAALERDDRIIEDVSWLRRKESAMHINVAELTAVVRGIALAIKWGAKRLKIMTDSSSVYWWLSAISSGSRRVTATRTPT